MATPGGVAKKKVSIVNMVNWAITGKLTTLVFCYTGKVSQHFVIHIGRHRAVKERVL